MSEDYDWIINDLKWKIDSLIIEQNISRNASSIYDEIKKLAIISEDIERCLSNGNTKKTKQHIKELKQTAKNLLDLS